MIKDEYRTRTKGHPVAPGQRIGPYRVLSHLSRGGMGDIFSAVHVELDRRVALKLPRLDVAHATLNCNCLLSEGRYLAAVQHTNVVLLYDLARTPDRVPYLALELLRGRPLSTLMVADRGFDPRIVIRVGKEVARGLAALHRAGIVCADVKPDNVMIVDGPLLDRSWRGASWVKLIDLGVAQPLGREAEGGMKGGDTSRPGGTPAYVSPEHVQGEALRPAADVYSLGVMMYELLVGALPFGDAGDHDLMWHHVHSVPPRLPEARHDHALELLDAVVQRCLAKPPAQRFGSMKELLEALDRTEALFGSPPDATRRGGGARRPQRDAWECSRRTERTTAPSV